MKTCPRCGSENLSEAKFCRDCGSALPEEPTRPFAVSEDSPSAPTFASAAAPAAPPVLIENNTPFTKKTFLELYKGVKKSGIVILVCGILLLAIYIATQVGDQALKELDMFSFIFGIIFVSIGVLYLFLPKIASKNQKLITDTTFRIFRFDEVFVHAALFDGEAKIEELNIPYTAITKIRRKGGFLWIWSGNAALPINMFTFTTGTKEDLETLLLAKCGASIVKIKK